MTIEEFCRLTGLVNFVCCFFFSIFIFFKNPRERLHQTFALFSFFVALWSFGYFCFHSYNGNYESANFWVRFLMLGCVPIPPIFLHFTITLLQLNSHSFYKRLVRISYFIFFLLLLFAPTPLMVVNLTPKYWYRLWPNPGFVWHLYTIGFFGILILSYHLLFREAFRSTGVRRKQMMPVAIGTFITFLGGSTNFFLWYDIPVAPVMNGLVIVYIILVFYAVLNYKFLEVEDILAIHRDKLMLLGLMSSSLTHEIKNPLFLIKGYTDKISTLSEKKNDSEIVEAISKLSGQVSRMSTLVTRLSDFGKPNPNPGMPEEIDIAQALENALFFAEQELKHHNIKLVKNIDSDLPRLKGYRGQFEEIFLNLIMNAFHAMSPPDSGRIRDDSPSSRLGSRAMSDGGTLTIVARSTSHQKPATRHNPHPLSLSLREREDRSEGEGRLTRYEIPDTRNGVEVSIADTGTGIPKENLKNIFKPFYSTKGKSGTGLGLHIVKTLVEQNGGKISVESEVDKGTTFLLRFSVFIS